MTLRKKLFEAPPLGGIKKYLIMELTVKALKGILKGLDDNMILADLQRGNDKFRAFSMIKRVMVLQDEKGQKYLTINSMGSHFTAEGEQSNLHYVGPTFTDLTQ